MQVYSSLKSLIYFFNLDYYTWLFLLLIQISNTFLNPAKLLASARPCGNNFPQLTVHSLCTSVDHGGISLSVPDAWSHVVDKKMSRNPRKWVKLRSLDSGKEKRWIEEMNGST